MRLSTQSMRPGHLPNVPKCCGSLPSVNDKKVNFSGANENSPPDLDLHILPTNVSFFGGKYDYGLGCPTLRSI